MKTTITTILTICLFMLSSTQSVQAQSEEETITWLKKNLGETVYVGEDLHVKNLDVSPCEISWTLESDEEFEYGNSYFFCSFNPALAGNWGNKGNGLILAEANVVYCRDYSGAIGSYYEHGSTVFSIKEGEEGFAEEIAKKLNHLATFCEQKN